MPLPYNRRMISAPPAPTIHEFDETQKGRHILSIDELAKVDANQIISEVKQNRFVIIRGLVEPDVIREGARKFRETFDIRLDHPSQGISPDQIMHNFQKWSIGVTSPRSFCARLFRSFYNPFWCEDIYGLHSQFEIISELRNILCDMPVGYGKEMEPDGLYSAVRIQQYPRGGGFMGAHTDHVGANNLPGSDNSRFIQVSLPLTKKGEDFLSGGGFVQNENTMYIIDDLCEIGDVVVYDASTLHGVLDIDPDVDFQPNDINGRLVGFVTLYRKWD